MATHSSLLAWENPMHRGAWWLQPTGLHTARHKLATKQQQLPKCRGCRIQDTVSSILKLISEMYLWEKGYEI